MSAQFIKLTRRGLPDHPAEDVYINPAFISVIEPYNHRGSMARVHTSEWLTEVLETPEQILALIKRREKAAL